MQQAGYCHAKIFATKLQTDFQLQGTEMTALVQEIVNTDNNPPIDNVQPPPGFAANATVQDIVQLEIIRLLRKIVQERHIGRYGQGG